MLATDVDFSDCIQLVKAEYLEMPGLSLTMPQAERLWHADAATCKDVFDRLIDDGFLRRTNAGTYVRTGRE